MGTIALRKSNLPLARCHPTLTKLGSWVPGYHEARTVRKERFKGRLSAEPAIADRPGEFVGRYPAVKTAPSSASPKKKQQTSDTYF